MNNEDTISRARIEEIRSRYADSKTADDYRMMQVSEIAKMSLDIKRLLKAVDAKPQVVHCEDCIYYHPDDRNGEKCWNCGGMTEPKDDDYCSRWAEKAGGSSRLALRKDGGDNAAG